MSYMLVLTKKNGDPIAFATDHIIFLQEHHDAVKKVTYGIVQTTMFGHTSAVFVREDLEEMLRKLALAKGGTS